MRSNQDLAFRFRYYSRTALRGLLLITAICLSSWGQNRSATAQSARSGLQPGVPQFVNPNTAPLPEKVKRYVIRVMDKYDLDKDGKLSREEWSAMSGSPQTIDLDADGVITLTELTYRIADHGLNYQARIIAYYASLRSGGGGGGSEENSGDGQTLAVFRPVSPPSVSVSGGMGPTASPGEGEPDQQSTEGAGYTETEVSEAVDQLLDAGDPWRRRYHLPPEQLVGLPAWFLMKDVDGDGQVTMLEFSPRVLMVELAQFGALDRNKDNLLTPDECRE
jgi:hypothetical protein